MADVIAAVASGDITLSEATELGKQVELYIKAEEALERVLHEQRREEWEEKDRWQRLVHYNAFR